MFQFPINKISVTSRFIIYNPFGAATMHYGMDFGCSVGTPLYAANSGTVVYSAYDSAGGNMLIVHDKSGHELSRYAHLKTRLVSTGQTVSRGDLIGYTGNTGSATTGAHLHFETWIVPKGYTYTYNGRSTYAVDPMCVCHLLSDQTFTNNGLTTCDPIPYPEPKITIKPARGTMSVSNANVRLRSLPETKSYQYVLGGYNRSHTVLGDFLSKRSFDVSYTCENEGYKWGLINTDLGQFWVAEIDGSTKLNVTESENPDVPIEPTNPTEEQLVIDISTWQKPANWEKVKTSNIKRVVIRQGFRGYGTGKIAKDNMLESHYAGAKSIGMPIDLYFFSQAINTTEAIEEANTCIEWAKGKDIGVIYIDIETANNGTGRADGNSKTTWTVVADAFCSTCVNAGYKSGIYANLSYFSSKLDFDALKAKGYLMWLAHYTSESHTEYKDRYDMWQYTSSGIVDGFDGGIDMNRLYTKIEDTEPDIPTPPNPDVPNTVSTLIIGPMSGGDKVSLVNKATELNLPVLEQSDGTLVIGPMSYGDEKTIREIAEKLQLPIVVKEDSETDPPINHDDCSKKIEELNSTINKLTLDIQSKDSTIAQLNATIKNRDDSIVKLNGVITEIQVALNKLK